MQRSKLVLISFIIITIILVSCNNSSIPNFNNKNKKKFNLGQSGLTMQDIIGSYDTTNNMGIITCKNIFQESINPDNFHLNIDENRNEGYAFFYNPDSTDQDYPCAGLSINNINFILLDTAYSTIGADGFPYDNTGLLFNYGNTVNTLHITGNDNIPGLDTSFNLYDPIRITNLHRGDTIHTSQALSINWSGNSSDYVAINFITSNGLISPSGYLYSTSAISHDNGSYSFDPNAYSQFPTGLYEIHITRWQPFIIHLDNGRNIAIIGESNHEISIFLIHD